MTVRDYSEQMHRKNKYKSLTEERKAYLKRLYDPEFRRLIEQIRQEKRVSRPV